ncbi:MAG TPA: phosphopantetheine-binding protein [Gaiellaceae bacterium]|nr:phosphopantetheine-binding protein [Gaiellaceae bacterium]
MTADVNERVRRLLAETLNVEVSSDEMDLIDTGVIDSLALVELLVALEREFEVTIPFDELEIDTFRSVRSIGEFIAVQDGRGG